MVRLTGRRGYRRGSENNLSLGNGPEHPKWPRSQRRTAGIRAESSGRISEIEAIYDEIGDRNGQFSNVYLTSRAALAGGNVTLGPVKLYAANQPLSAPNASNAGYYGTAAPTALP